MKAVVFGGAGVEGGYAVNCLTEHEKISEIVIADIDVVRGEIIAKKHEKIQFLKTDVTDSESLKRAFDGADVAVNCVGPFYKFASPILKTSIAKGVDYVDICDDYDTMEELLDTYDASAKDAGVTCIVGLGASPGLTNIMAKYASEQLTKQGFKTFLQGAMTGSLIRGPIAILTATNNYINEANIKTMCDK